MSKPQPIEEIVAWSQKRSGWQQDALRRLAIGGTLSVADKADLLLLLKAKAGFKLTPTPPAPIPFAVKDFTGASKGPPVALKGIQGVKGVNRLVDGANITFSPAGLTVIYGRNGSGKSGYVRVLRSACRTRLDNPAKLKVLDNVYGAATGPQSADIIIDAGAGDTPVPWGPAQPKPDELLQVAVFDSAAAALYVDQGHQIRFLPFGLDLLHKLNEVCLELRETLDAERAQVDAALGLAVVNFPEERPSKSQKFYANLSGETADDKITSATLFGPDEQARLDELNELLGSGATSSTDLFGLAEWTATLAQHCGTVSSALGNSRLKELAKQRKDYDAARKAASLDAMALFAGEPLDGVGESEWRLLWEAARNYSVAQAYPDAAFPVLEVGTEPASCVLCQQSLSEVAAQRLERFQLFVDGELNRKANASKLVLDGALAALPSLDGFDADDWKARLDQIAARILVDNGSSDGTWDVLGRVATEAPSGAVLRIVEGERGFVPPRDRGVRHAALLAAERGCQADQLLILQADADTEYLPYYIERMRAAAGANTLLEASIGREKSDDPRLANYRALELEVDGRTRSLEVADSDEVLIDDKACGYRLSDYQRWGGLRREYLPDGSEIHAETSRMYLRALAGAGAKRERVERAGALTSARRIYENPTLNFATAGFPREASWLHAFADATGASGGPRVQMDETRSTISPMAQRLRVGHNVVLFSLLPRIVAHLLGRRLNGDERLQGVIEALPRFKIEDLRQRPGWMISLLLSMLDDPGSPLHTLIDSIDVNEPRAFDLS